MVDELLSAVSIISCSLEESLGLRMQVIELQSADERFSENQDDQSNREQVCIGPHSIVALHKAVRMHRKAWNQLWSTSVSLHPLHCGHAWALLASLSAVWKACISNR